MPLSETCGYRPNPDFQPNEFCGKTQEQHTLLLHSFVPSNVVMVHLRGSDGPLKCMVCDMLWFMKEDDVFTCVSCKQRYQALSA